MSENKIYKNSQQEVYKKNFFPKNRFKQGFTLVEVLVLVFVLVIIMGAITASLLYVYRGQRFAFEQADATRSARLGIERSVRDLRETSYADDGAYPIVSIATSTVTFYSDYDNDGKIERIRYFLENGNFKIGTVESSGDPAIYDIQNEVISTVSDNVRNGVLGTSLFTYYDKSGILISDYSDIGSVAFVIVRLVVNINPNRAPNDFELTSSAALRNIK